MEDPSFTMNIRNEQVKGAPTSPRSVMTLVWEPGLIEATTELVAVLARMMIALCSVEAEWWSFIARNQGVTVIKVTNKHWVAA